MHQYPPRFRRQFAVLLALLTSVVLTLAALMLVFLSGRVEPMTVLLSGVIVEGVSPGQPVAAAQIVGASFGCDGVTAWLDRRRDRRFR